MCDREMAWESRLQKREITTVIFFLVWVYFEHEGFESGFRDLTLCVKALRQEAQRERFVVPLEPIEPSRV